MLLPPVTATRSAARLQPAVVRSGRGYFYTLWIELPLWIYGQTGRLVTVLWELVRRVASVRVLQLAVCGRSRLNWFKWFHRCRLVTSHPPRQSAVWGMASPPPGCLVCWYHESRDCSDSCLIGKLEGVVYRGIHVAIEPARAWARMTGRYEPAESAC